MSTLAYKRLSVVLGACCAFLLVTSVALFLDYAPLKVRVALASEQVHIFHEMRERALRSTVTDAAQCLQYVVGYYPSGSKQKPGSRLDGLVESARADSVREIVSYLHAKTGEDLGSNPEAWIQRYAKP